MHEGIVFIRKCNQLKKNNNEAKLIFPVVLKRKCGILGNKSMEGHVKSSKTIIRGKNNGEVREEACKRSMSNSVTRMNKKASRYAFYAYDKCTPGLCADWSATWIMPTKRIWFFSNLDFSYYFLTQGRLRLTNELLPSPVAVLDDGGNIRNLAEFLFG